MIATKNKIGIFYRYNKHQPINGSLFYALEYYFTLRDTIDKINNDNSILNRDPLEHEVTLYWIFPKKLISTKENKEKVERRRSVGALPPHPRSRAVDSRNRSQTREREQLRCLWSQGELRPLDPYMGMWLPWAAQQAR